MDFTDPPAIEASILEWEGERFEAHGKVTIRWQGRVLTCQNASWDGTLLQLDTGSLEGPEGKIAFQSAILSGVGQELRLEAVTVDGVLRGHRVVAESVSGQAGDWRIQGVDLSLCACAPGQSAAPDSLAVSAKEVELRGGSLLVISGGVGRVFGFPLVPLPRARLHLDPDHFRLLLPEVGYGGDGGSARLHGRFGLWDREWELGPAWRQDRGFRGELQVKGEHDELAVESGWDTVLGAPRGLVVSRGGRSAAGGTRRVGWDLSLSDTSYAEDYDVSYVGRGLGWRDNRAVAGVGPARLWLELPTDRSLLDANLRLGPVVRAGPMRLEPRLELGFRSPDILGADPLPRVAIGQGLYATERVGPVRLDLGVDAEFSVSRGWNAPGAEGEVPFSESFDPANGGGAGQGAGALGELRVSVPMWAPLFSHTISIFPGIAAGGLWSAGELGEPVGRGLGPTRLWPAETTGLGGVSERTAEFERRLGPTLGWEAGHRARVSGDATLGWEVGAPLTERESLSPSARVGVDAGKVRGWGRVGTGFAELGGGGGDELQLGASGGRLVVVDGALYWVHGEVGVKRAWLVTALGADLGAAPGAAGALTRVEGRLGYDDGCLSAVAVAEHAPDRAFPQLGLKLGWIR